MKRIFVFILSLIILGMPLSTMAASFNPSLIVTDSEMENYKSMDMNAIKNFLVDKGSTLANYVDKSVRMYAYQIIYDAANTYKINPKYVLSLLQKEQSLITDKTPSEGQLNWATGYGCPDGGGCNDKYKWLAQQIDWGVGGTRYYLDHPEEFKYQIGKAYNIDGQSVVMKNNATRALYTYTPHIHGNELLHSLWSGWFSINYSDGTLLQNVEDGGIWIIQNGLRRPFLSKSAFASRYSFDNVIEIKQSDLEKFEKGTGIKFANYSLLHKPTGEIYLLDDETLRHIENEEAFRMLGFNPEEVESVTEEDLIGYVLGDSITVSSAYPTGALLQDATTGGVYYVKSGIKYPIWSKALMLHYYGDKKLTKVSQEELENFPTGLPVKIKNGELVKSKTKPVVYFISNGLRRPIADGATFEGLGYKWKNILEIEDKVLDLHGLGESIKSED